MTVIVIPIVITSSGAQPASPQDLRDTLVAYAQGLSPGLTANLPGTLIDDIASTDVGALVITDSALVDLINSISATNANDFLLGQLGQQYGVPKGLSANGSVYVQFTSSPPTAGVVFARGFTVSDGTNQYVVQDGGVTLTDGITPPLFCIAVQSGIFPIPAASVTQFVTSAPPVPGVTFTVTNPSAGLPATAVETEGQYRARILEAGQAVAQGVPEFLKTLLQQVYGVQPRLVSFQQSGSQWIVVVGGGDPYAVGYAILQGIPDIANLTSSVLEVSAITNANPGVVTTDIAHGYITGTIIQINGATGISGINGVNFTATVLTPYTFSIGHDTTSSGAYTGGGVLTPNVRNQSVSINDFPDSYTVPFVVPLQEAVTVSLVWNTNSTNFVSATAVAALATPAIVNYINGIPTGQPINIFELQNVFQEAIVSLLPTPLVSKMQFTITINGNAAAPISGTGIIPGDAYSYFQITAGDVTITQG